MLREESLGKLEAQFRQEREALLEEQDAFMSDMIDSGLL